MSEELDSAMMDVQARLKDRGVDVSMDDDSDVVAQVLEAVERFEKAVEKQGGDLMIDTGDAEQPDDPRFVLPKRAQEESLPDYCLRIDDATRMISGASR